MPLLTFMPEERQIHVKNGVSVLNAARMHRIPIRTRCNGQASCLMCKVIVSNAADSAGLSEPSAREQHKLGSLLDQGIRLACQAIVRGDATVTVPEDPLKAVIRARLAQQEQEDIW